MQDNLIETAQALDEFISAIAGETLLAVDTEFFRETSYFPELGLVQLATREHLACVDPIAFDAREGLAKILLDKNITKLFHSCSQDLEVLLLYLGELPCPVIDTQIAAAMVGDKDQISYADIVAQLLGTELDKSQTRTNWLKRPLSKKQLQYAAEDVLYLIPVYEQLLETLQQKQRADWLLHDCAQLCQSAERYTPDIEKCWTRVKGTQKLDGRQLAVVDALARWREHKAIALNRTRRQVISDDFIVQAAIEQPADITGLRACGKYASAIDEEDFDAMLSLLQQALQTDADSWPAHPRRRLTNEQKQSIRELMQSIELKAEELGMAQSTLASRKEVEQLVNGQRQLNLLTDWRLTCIGEQLLSQLAD